MKVKVEVTVNYKATRKFVVEREVDASPDDLKVTANSIGGFRAFDQLYDQIDADDLDFNEGEEITALEGEINDLTIIAYKTD